MTAFIPSNVFQRGADPLFVVAEITNNLSRPIKVSDHPRSQMLLEGESTRWAGDELKPPVAEALNALLVCEFLYAKSVPPSAGSRVIREEGALITIEPGETRLVKLKLDLGLVSPGRCRWRVAVRLGGGRRGSALGISQTLDIEVAGERGKDRKGSG